MKPIYSFFDEEAKEVIVTCLVCGATVTAPLINGKDGTGPIILTHEEECASTIRGDA